MRANARLCILARCTDCVENFGHFGQLVDTLEEAQTWAATHTRNESWQDQPWKHDDFQYWRIPVTKDPDETT